MDDPGQDVLRALLRPERGCADRLCNRIGCDLVEPALRLHPEPLLNDAQFRSVFDDPLVAAVHPRDALARLRVAPEMLAVPDQPSDIEFVAQDAGPARRMAADRGVLPGCAIRPGDLIAVQPPCDGSRRGLRLKNGQRCGGRLRLRRHRSRARRGSSRLGHRTRVSGGSRSSVPRPSVSVRCDRAGRDASWRRDPSGRCRTSTQIKLSESLLGEIGGRKPVIPTQSLPPDIKRSFAFASLLSHIERRAS